MRMDIKAIFILIILSLFSWSLTAQEAGDTRYNSGLNLPFNAKAGDYNPQTGDISIRATDVALPGRGGYDFTFGRIWALSRSNVFNMYYKDGNNQINCNTIDKSVKMGVGWASTLPFILENEDGDYSTLNLFFGASVYSIDQQGILSDRDDRSNLLGYDLLDKRIRISTTLGYAAFNDNNYSLDLDAIGYSGVSSTESKYLLTLKNQEKYWFGGEGKLMMQEDVNSNRIWYFYDVDGLALVVDTIGRQISFDYSPEGNLQQINWVVHRGYIDESTRKPTYDDDFRSVLYNYQNAETVFSEIDWLSYQDAVASSGYITPYLLTSVQDPVNQ